MRNSKSSTALLEQQPNIQAMLSTPLQAVDPILEIQSLYNIDQFTACDIYEGIGDDYTNQNMVACMFGIASPAYLAELKGLNNLKGGVSC